MMPQARLKRDQRKRDSKTQWWWEDLPSHPAAQGWQGVIQAAQTTDDDVINNVPLYGIAPSVS